MDDVIELPKFRYNDKNINTAPHISSYETVITQAFEGIYPTPEKPLVLPPEQAEMVNNIINFQSQWIKKNLGISVDSRIPPPEDISFYSEEDFKAISKRFNLQDYSSAITFAARRAILINLPEGQNTFMDIVGHELIHTLSDYSIKITGFEESPNTPQLMPVTSGLKNRKNGVFQGMGEWITQMMNVEILNEYKRTELHQDQIINPSSYQGATLFLSLLVEQAAERLQVPAKNLRNLLYIGLLTGNTGTLRFFNEAFGKDSIRMLSQLSDDTAAVDFINPFQILTGNPDLYKDSVNTLYNDTIPVHLFDDVFISNQNHKI